MKKQSGGVTTPKGFQAIGVHVGLKKKRKDVALLVSDVPAVSAAMYTTNVVKAAPVLWSQKISDAGQPIRGFIVNSGNANACTGDQGYQDAVTMAHLLAKGIQCQPEEVLVASTGVIGVPLQIEKLSEHVPSIVPLLDHTVKAGSLAAEAIMTTDTFSKETACELEIGGKTVKIGAMAKGSGMIHPNMATMLAFITTDVAISREMLDKCLKETVKATYNMISVDGDTSTNDMVAVMANGLAENPCITSEGADYDAFCDALMEVNKTLAKAIILDGEGATKLLEVVVHGGKTLDDAQKLAKSVISSSLVKTAFFGEDANWGRVLAAMGYSGVTFDPSQVTIRFESDAGQIDLMLNGLPLLFDEEKALKILKEKHIFVNITLKEGTAEATAWGCDLSYDYVKINGAYRT